VERIYLPFNFVARTQNHYEASKKNQRPHIFKSSKSYNPENRDEDKKVGGCWLECKTLSREECLQLILGKDVSPILGFSTLGWGRFSINMPPILGLRCGSRSFYCPKGRSPDIFVEKVSPQNPKGRSPDI